MTITKIDSRVRQVANDDELSDNNQRISILIGPNTQQNITFHGTLISYKKLASINLESCKTLT